MTLTRRFPPVIARKALGRGAVTVVVLFLVALPLGDSHHGLGRHSHAVADLGQAIFVIFELGVVILVAMSVLSLLQYVALRRRAG